MQVSFYPHASLLVSVSNTLRRESVFQLAKDWLCTSERESACNHCRSCQLFDRSSHPDFYRIEADQNHIAIDQIRELVQETVLAPIESARKVFVIPDAHYMRLESANALLKILEEPPDYTFFILGAPYAEMLLPTIQSRCQLIRLPNVDEGVPYQKISPVLDVLDRVLSGDYLSIFSNGKIWESFKDDKMILFKSLRIYLLALKTFQSTQNTDHNQWHERFKSIPKIHQSIFSSAILEIDQISTLITINLNFQLSIESWLLKIWEMEYGKSRRRLF